MDHPGILELVVDADGWSIHIHIHNCDSVTLCEPPRLAGSDPDVLLLGWNFGYEEELSREHRGPHATAVELKVGWVHLRPHRVGLQRHPVVLGYRLSREQRDNRPCAPLGYSNEKRWGVGSKVQGYSGPGRVTQK